MSDYPLATDTHNVGSFSLIDRQSWQSSMYRQLDRNRSVSLPGNTESPEVWEKFHSAVSFLASLGVDTIANHGQSFTVARLRRQSPNRHQSRIIEYPHQSAFFPSPGGVKTRRQKRLGAATTVGKPVIKSPAVEENEIRVLDGHAMSKAFGYFTHSITPIGHSESFELTSAIAASGPAGCAVEKENIRPAQQSNLGWGPISRHSRNDKPGPYAFRFDRPKRSFDSRQQNCFLGSVTLRMDHDRHRHHAECV